MWRLWQVTTRGLSVSLQRFAGIFGWLWCISRLEAGVGNIHSLSSSPQPSLESCSSGLFSPPGVFVLRFVNDWFTLCPLHGIREWAKATPPRLSLHRVCWALISHFQPLHSRLAKPGRQQQGKSWLSPSHLALGPVPAHHGLLSLRPHLPSSARVLVRVPAACLCFIQLLPEMTLRLTDKQPTWTRFYVG